MAGALGFKLSGPRVYHGALTEDPWIGEGSSDLTASDIRRALSLYRTSCAVQIVFLRCLCPHRASLSSVDLDMGFEMRGERIERASQSVRRG